MTILKIIAVIVLLGRPLSVFAQTDPPNAGNQPGYSIYISANQTETKRGDPIKIDIALTNISDKTINEALDREGRSELDFDVLVEDQRGVEAPTTAYLRALRGKRMPEDPGIQIDSSRKGWSVQPGKSLATRIDIARLYRIEAPGTYTVRIERLDKGSGIRVKSNALSLTVTP